MKSKCAYFVPIGVICMKEKEIDYKLMYHKMVNAAEDAIRILIKAQVECEDMFLDAAEKAEKDVELHRKFSELMECQGVTITDDSILDNLEKMSG